MQVEWHRGFISIVRCRLEDWCGTECPECGGRGRFFTQTPEQRGTTRVMDRQCPSCLGTGRLGAHGPAIVAAQPVTRVITTDKRPSPNQLLPGRWCWLHPDVPSGYGYTSSRHEEYLACRLPLEIFTLVQGGPGSVPRCKWYDSEQGALEALSDALVRWARQAAKLIRFP